MKQPKKHILKQKELSAMVSALEQQTSGITNHLAANMLESDGQALWTLMNAHIKKLPLILLSFKLGYMHGKSTLEKKSANAKRQNKLFQVFVKLQKASTALHATIENYGLGNANLSQGDIIAIGCNANNISDMIAIADDYIYYAQQELEKDFLQ